MADEISYEVMGVNGTNLIVKYTLVGHSMDLMIPLDPTDDVDKQIRHYAPRRALAAMQRQPAELQKLVGLTGSASLEETPEEHPQEEPPPQEEAKAET